MNGGLLMQYLKDEVKYEILKSALDEFYNKNYKESSMRNIAKNAGMTVGNLYRYFKNKDEIFEDLINPVVKSILDLLQSHEKHHLFQEGNYEELNTFLAKSLMAIHNDFPKELSILLHGSDGSSLEGFRYSLIKQMADHIKEHCYLGKECEVSNEIEPIILMIIARNNVEGYITILESDLSIEAKERAIFQYSGLVTQMKFCQQ